MIQRLASFAALQVSGPDALNFLQGQLSHDVQQLSGSQSLLASINSAQGRVQAVVLLLQRADDILLLLPSELAASTLTRLQKYVLRAKVRLADLSRQLPLFAASGAALNRAHLPTPPAPGAVVHPADITLLRWPSADQRYLIAGEVTSAPDPEGDAANHWRLADIRAGLPQVFPATHEAFVAQMLNLDLLNGISFDKGCYTGQEIIARAHFRGAVKRRMFRFSAACEPPAPGTRVQTQREHAGDVVMSAATESGCELLAVLHLTQIEQWLELAGCPGVELVRQDLPYEVPIPPS